ncbi:MULTISPECIES: hypothetical protein [Pseudomonas]|uniref:hypothetical protein n=1 Tax=Pseudomonas TaxID=286 RepID=UPI0010BF6ED8|nr:MULTISPECIES: hypothetical protein [Pseudomonas]MBF8731087.1 hypothetical protein [Pseudomonas guariconensis]MEC4022889.1 hypothetical protein [Pseudomonas fulva]QUG91224.1 hypothetical protein GR140_21560 [Pseudomonas putida]QUG92519.1 hypothetical protein GR140_27490 [Pseudomonas putida]WPU62620.1 hypothetical protein SQW15_11795 [Pseudomonas asiatica]
MPERADSGNPEEYRLDKDLNYLWPPVTVTELAHQSHLDSLPVIITQPISTNPNYKKRRDTGGTFGIKGEHRLAHWARDCMGAAQVRFAPTLPVKTISVVDHNHWKGWSGSPA